MTESFAQQGGTITLSANRPEDVTLFSEGSSWRCPPGKANQVAADDPVRSMVHGAVVVIEFADVESVSGYVVDMVFLSDAPGRRAKVTAGDIVLEESLDLPGEEILRKQWPVPAAAVRNGTLSFVVSRLEGPNAILSSLTLRYPEGVATPKPYVEEAPLAMVQDLTWPPEPESVEGLAELKIDLNGQWQLHAAPPEDFWKGGDATGWRNVEVPGEWEMQGVSVEPGATVAYRREFFIPPDWSGRRVRLRFDSVFAECQVWVNGQNAGSHSGGFTPFDLDVTNLARYGNKNTIAVAVKSRGTLADNLSSACRYAAHDIGGILRKVSVLVLPEVCLADVFVTTSFDANYQDATARVELAVQNASSTACRATVRIKVFRLRNGQPEGEAVAEGKADFGLLAQGLARQAVELDVREPAKWDPEHPNLYRLECEVVVDAAVMEKTGTRFGFRQVEVRENQVFVNGHPIKLRGVCRHESHPTRGRALAEPLWRKDAELYRAGNCNHIRTSHYPPAEEFLEACDELGLFVECEAPLCWVWYSGAASGDPQVQESIIRQTLEMVAAYRNHPSVLFWSLANESVWGKDFRFSGQLVRAADPSRPQTFNYSAMGTGDKSVCEIGSDHYPGPSGPDRYRDHERPVSFGEYCHLNAYNRHELSADPGLRDVWGRGFRKMWDAMYDARGVLGGSIWAAMDDTFILPDGRVFGYGQWGPLDNWRRPKPEYWHMKKTYSPVRIDESKLVLEPERVIELAVQNRAFFSNLLEYEIRWTLRTRAGVRSGVAKADVPPGGQGTVQIELGTVPVKEDVLQIEFMDPRGFVADAYAYSFAAVAEESSVTIRNVEPVRESNDFLLRAGSTSVRIQGSNGSLQAETDGKSWLIGGPYLVLLPLNGSGGAQMSGSSEFAPFNPVCGNWKLIGAEVKDDSEVVVQGTFDEADTTFTYRLCENGALVVAYEAKVRVALDPRQIGLAFDVPATFQQVAWRRLAPYGVYPDDHIGRPEGSAHAFRKGNVPSNDNPRMEPTWPWSLDETAGGTHDFRSTKERILEYRVTDKTGFGARVCSNGQQHARAWVHEGGIVRFLVADYSNFGGEGFLRAHALPEKRPLNTEDSVQGSVILTSMGD